MRSAAIVAATAALVAVMPHAGAGASTAPAEPLTWTACEGGECATATVPLDSTKPGGEQVDVALFRLPARVPDQRIGVLVWNPGGPGDPGTGSLRRLGSALPDAVRDRFDVVAYDARATGATLPLRRCAEQLDAWRGLDLSPDDAAGRAEIAREARRIASGCGKANGSTLAHVSSLDTVRDLDRIRTALGEDELSFWGESYGTFVTALYTQLFPEHVRAAVLDGPYDASRGVAARERQLAEGLEGALGRFFDWCRAGSDCAFGADGDAAAAYDALVDDLAASSRTTADGRPFGTTQLANSVLTYLYGGERSFADLASALAAASAGDVEPLVAAGDSAFGRGADGTYDAFSGSYYAISCADERPISDRARRGLEAEFAAASPHFGPELLYELAVCSSWPVPPARVPAIHARGAAPALILSATGDPVTPPANAKRLARALPGSTIVPYDDTGHAFALTNGCVKDVAAQYLVDLTVPAASC